MITNKRDQAICDKYGAYDDTGHVHCFECPLSKSEGSYDFRCKANSHYDRHTREWEWDNERFENGLVARLTIPNYQKMR